jgi:hypothetical protein
MILACSVAFTATYLDGAAGDAMTFHKVPVNYGNDFSGATGLFTCRIPGLYAFSVTLSRQGGIRHNVHTYLSVRNGPPLTLFRILDERYRYISPEQE